MTKHLITVALAGVATVVAACGGPGPDGIHRSAATRQPVEQPPREPAPPSEQTRAGFREVHVPPRVAREDLVAPVTREDDLHVLTGQLGEEVQRQRGRDREGLVRMPDDPRQRLDEIRGQIELVVLRPVERSHLAGVRALVELRVPPEGAGEGHHGLGGVGGGHGHHRPRVHAPAQERAHRHVREQV